MSDEFVVTDPEASDSGTAGFVDPKVEDCPLVPMGFKAQNIYLLLPEGELREVPAPRIQTMLRTDLYASIEGAAFLGNWRDGEGKLDLVSAGRWLVRKCRARGIWDGTRPMRGLGVWATDDGPVVHVGDAIGRWPFAEADWISVVEMSRAEVRGPVWMPQAAAPRPKAAARATDVEAFRRLLDKWRFRAMPDSDGMTEADVVLGHLGVMLLGAWPRFRPHLNVVGGAGTGKTTLSRLMQAAASANAGEMLDSFSDAGIKQTLTGEARGLFLDEAEPSPDGVPGPVEKLMEILRRMSTGEGASGRQGSAHGVAVSTSALGCAYLASIFPLAPGDAMATRMVEVRLSPLGKAKGADDDALEAAIHAARELSPRLLARAVRDAKRFRQDVAMLKSALGELGQGARAADLVATLAAGRRLLLHDQALDLDGAIDEVRRWLSLAKGREAASATQNPGEACLAQIWATNSGQHSKDRHLTIGEMIEEEAISPGYHEKVLKTFGLIVENGHGASPRPGPHLIISNNHPALKKALGHTQFHNWRGVLEHLGDLGEAWAAKPLDGPRRFGLHQSRALAVPLTPWLGRPVAVGASPRESSPFDPPDWAGEGVASHGLSRPASHEQSHD